MRKTIGILILLLFPVTGFAADVYLDISATGCTGGGQANTNYNSAKRSCGSGTEKVYAGNYPYEASTSLSAGDTLYIREGEYYEDITGKPGYMWQVGALTFSVSNLTVKPYNKEVVWLKGGPSRTTPQFHPNNVICVTNKTSNVTIEGFYIYGGNIIGGTNTVIKNCDLSGGWDHQAAWKSNDASWPNVIRFEGGNGVKVQNCKLHDNMMQDGNAANMAIIMHENDTGTIVENCIFYNLAKNLAYIKYQNHTGHIQATYRYNVIDSSCTGIDGSLRNGEDVYIYQNIFIGSQSAGFDHMLSTGGEHVYIYNNTYYNVGRPLFNWNGTSFQHQFFNNIIYHSVSGKNNLNYENQATSFYSDYNIYYTKGASASWVYNGGTVATTLSGWKAYTSSIGYPKDVNSVDTNPNFLNSSGTFSQPSDFKRSSYPTNGRGGSWPSVMGAYITGNETIGAR